MMQLSTAKLGFMLRFIVGILLAVPLVQAQPPTQPLCEELIGSIEAAFDGASEVIMSTEIRQGILEYAYSKMRLYKQNGVWESSVLEQRGVRRPDNAGQSDEGEAPSFQLSCQQAVITALEEGWLLELEEENPDFPIKAWTLRFVEARQGYLPVEVRGQIDTRIAFIPFRGTVISGFEAWQFPLQYVNPNER